MEPRFGWRPNPRGRRFRRESQTFPRPPTNSIFSPSKKEGTISSTGPDHWIRRGFELKAILSEIFHTTKSRIELPPAPDLGTRYDFVLVPLEPKDDENMEWLVQEGIEKDLHVTITTETRPVDLYVVTAMESKKPPIRKSEDESFLASGHFLQNGG
jgi:hypothetical protein